MWKILSRWESSLLKNKYLGIKAGGIQDKPRKQCRLSFNIKIYIKIFLDSIWRFCINSFPPQYETGHPRVLHRWKRSYSKKEVPGNAELCQEGSTLAGRVSAQTSDLFLGTSGYISPLLKSTSKPGPCIRIGERKHPFAMKCELFVESQRVVESIRANSGDSKQNTLTARVDKHLPHIQN